MKINIRKYAKAFLAGVLSLALVLQAFNGLSFVSKATTETDVHADKVIIPTAETVTAGDASTNGVTDANITFTGFSGYPTADNAFAGYLEILTAKYSDITSGAITAAMTKNSAVVLQFTNPINVANHNRMTINIAMCGWSNPTAPSTTYIYASGASDLATDNAIDTFTTDNNYNVTLDVSLDLTKYADADGYVRNLTFLCDSTVNYNYLFGAFRLSYEDVHADTVIYPTTETVTAGDASTNGVTDANITFTGFSGYPTADNAFAGYLEILTAKYSDITSGAITAAMTKNSAVVLQFTEPINVANHNKMTINIAMCGWSNPTAPSTTYIYASGASDLATENAIDTFTTDNNYNVTLDVNLDLSKYADADGYVRNLTFLCDSTVNYNYLFGAFRLSYEDVHAATVIYPTAETVTAGNASTNGVTDANITFTGFSGYPTADNAFAGYLEILTAKYSDITSGAITAAMTKNNAVVLQFTNPINVANHNKMTINIAMCGWSNPTAPSTTYIYASGASDLATENAIDTFTTDNNYNVTLDVNLDLSKYADADGYVRNLTFLCDSTVNYNYLFGAFRLSYNDVHADTVIIPTAETVTVGDASTNGVSDSSVTFTTASEYNTSGGVFDLFSGYSDITSILNVLGNNNGTAFVLKFAEPIDVSNHNVMTVNAVIGAWTDGSSTFKVNMYGSGATDLATDKAIGSFETVGNFNQSVTFTMDLSKYADADGLVRNLTFRLDTASTQACWIAFGAFRLSYDATAVEPDTPGEPTYTELAFGDWSTSVGVVEGSNIYSLAGHDDITSLDGVAISGKVNFNGSNWLRIGGTEDVKNGGLWFGSHSAGLYMVPQGIGGSGDYFPVDATEWETLKNTEFTLRVTFDKATDGSAWTVGVFVNGTEKGSYTITGLNPGLYIGIDSAITVDMTPSESGTPNDPDTSTEPDDSKTYTDLTFSNWGILDGEYISGYAYDLTNGLTSLNGTAFNGVLNFNGTATWLRLGAPDGWAGLLFTVRENVLIVDSEISGFNSLDYQVPYAEKNLLTEEFKLRLTFDYDSGNNVKLGIWIDDEFQRYLTYKGMATAMGTNLLIDTADVTIADVGTKDEETDTTPTEKETLPKNLTEVTFESFGIKDGTYKYNGNLLAAEGQYARPLGSSIFSGDFYIPSGSNVDFRYGGVSLNWFGLIFANTADGKLYMEGIADDVKVTNSYVFNPTKAGTEFIDTWFNLKLTTEIVDSDSDGAKDDVKLGVWFNDVLYNNKYIELQDYAQYLGNRVGVYVRDADSSVKLKTDTTVYMGVDFTLFGFTRNWEKELGLK